MQKTVPYSKAFAAMPPREVVIAIARSNTRLGAFRLAKEFVIALPCETQAEETMLYGTKSGRDCDKLALAGAKLMPATKINCVLLSDAAANYECRLIAEMAVGNHVVLFGEVVADPLNDYVWRKTCESACVAISIS